MDTFLISDGSYDSDATNPEEFKVFIVVGKENVAEAVKKYAAKYDVDPDLVAVNHVGPIAYPTHDYPVLPYGTPAESRALDR